MRGMPRHVIWDWNGTLLADQHAVIDALNVLLADLGQPPTDMETYRRLYTRPVRVFYERLLQRPVDDHLWGHIDGVFHDAYFTGIHEVALDDQAVSALDRVATAGATQSLLSMAPHDHLTTMVHHHAIDGHFVRVDGVRGVGGGRKVAWLRRHLDRLALHDNGHVVMIGDAVDDAEAATGLGIPAVLYDGGSHPRDDLEAVGVPVVDTLHAAVAAAGIGG